ncbi:MAG TPA: sugar nucleotide-binding protein, partial [Hyphomicrobiaceae bacterium]|nr:sugar nucleotide-binding protein [Hyphomicrobiaceae bacterium]
YCDFNSHVRERVEEARWQRAYLAELERAAAETPGRVVTSVFFGGGTPSLMPPETAAAILAIARQLKENGAAAKFGTYHLAGSGTTTWCGLAREALAVAGRHGGRSVPVHAISSAEYPTPARRPKNSVLDCRRSTGAFGVTLPEWQAGVEASVRRLLSP